MFVRKSRHFTEFAFILFIVCVFSYFLAKAFLWVPSVHLPHNDLEFNPNSAEEVNVLIEDN